MATRGQGWSWGLIGALVGLALVQPGGCKRGGEGRDGDAFAGALAAVGPEVVLPALEQFGVAAEGLSSAVAAWEAALDGGGDAEAERVAAQDAWADAMAVWEELEVMQIGPAGSSLTAVAGRDVRDRVYSWPTVNPCLVDQQTVEGDWDEPTYFTENLVNAYGLGAVEHLVFADLANDCPAEVDINATGSWDALGDAGVRANRAAFAAALVAEVRREVDGLQTTWSPDGGDFSGLLVADTADSPYDSQQQAMNAVFDAMFYLELKSKDRKLGVPLGLQDCPAATCPESVEGLQSGRGAAFVAANLRGFRALFAGGEGEGMDDVLAELGHQDFSDEILADADTALALAEAIERPLDAQIAADPASVQALYDALTQVTDALKGDVATVLALQIPAEAAGDAD